MLVKIRLNACLLIFALLACIQAGCGKNPTTDALIEDAPIIEDEGKGTDARLDRSPFPLQMTIAPEGPQTRDRLSIRAKVKNVSDKPCGWDSRFAVYCFWLVSLENADRYKDRFTVSESIESEKSRSRFISLAPGQSASRVFILTRPFRVFKPQVESIPNTKDARSVGAVEQAEKYVIPETAKGIEVRWNYGIYYYENAFRVYFGFAPKDVRMPGGSSQSNDLRITFSD
jgi:hypothetical protein